MKTRTADILCLVFVAAASLVAAVLYPDLPEQIPTHWNAAGEADDYTAKPWGVILFPLIAIFCWVLMKIIPAISPKGFRTGEFADVIAVFQVALVGFTSAIAVLVVFAARGADVSIENVVPLGVGLLFVVLGNYLGKVRKNFFIGIRTPWTLASDEVWARTHRLGGWIFMICGLLLMASAFFRQAPQLIVGAVVAAALIPVIYSYVLYRRLEGFSDNETDDLA